MLASPLLVKIAATLWFFDREMPFLAKLFSMASLQATKKPNLKPLKSSAKKALSIDRVTIRLCQQLNILFWQWDF
jgi:hypothetical protein